MFIGDPDDVARPDFANQLHQPHNVGSFWICETAKVSLRIYRYKIDPEGNTKPLSIPHHPSQYFHQSPSLPFPLSPSPINPPSSASSATSIPPVPAPSPPPLRPATLSSSALSPLLPFTPLTSSTESNFFSIRRKMTISSSSMWGIVA